MQSRPIRFARTNVPGTLEDANAADSSHRHFDRGAGRLPAAGTRAGVAPLRLKLLGAPELTRGGHPVPLKRRKSVALLAYLILTERTHTREALAALLNGDTTDGQARRYLRNILDDLRDHVGDYLLITGETVAFDCTRPHELDLAALRRATERPATPGEIDAAIALCDGELLAGFVVPGAEAFDDWLQLEREHARSMLIQALERQLADRIERGDRAADATARRLLALDPWREDTHRQMMLLRARAGRRAAALAHYAEFRRNLADELGVEPEEATTALRERIRVGPTTPPHNLPAPALPLVGREEELDTLTRQLADPDCHLVTILGIGGSGKTRLALEAAARYTRSELPDDQPFPDGIFVVDLADHDPDRADRGKSDAECALAAAVLIAAGQPVSRSTEVTRQLLTWCRAQRMLLVLDSAENALPARELLGRLLRHAPGVTLLASSRTSLALLDEWVLNLAGLRIPDGPAEVEDAPASELFLHLARRARLAAPYSTADYPAIARICQLAGGLPLAILLAASCVRSATPAQIAARLQRDLDLPDGAVPALPPRQRSLRAILDHAWAALAPEEQLVLRQLAVFRGSFSAAAAVAVSGTAPAHLPALCNRALLAADGARFSMHALIRRGAAERLAAVPAEAARVAARHAAYCAALAERHAAALRRDPDERDTLAPAVDDLRAAWAWASDRAAAAILARLREGLATWYDLSGLFEEWAERFGWAAGCLRAALAERDDPESRAVLGNILADQALALSRLGRHDAALVPNAEARALANATESVALTARAEYLDGLVAFQRGLLVAAEQALSLALIHARAAGDSRLQGDILALLGRLAFTRGESAEARALYEGALARFGAAGERANAAGPTLRLGLVLLGRDDERAATLIADGLALARAFGHRRLERVALTAIGLYHDQARGRYTEAEGHLAQALRIAEEIGDRDGVELVRAALGLNAILQGDLRRAVELLAEVPDADDADGGTEGQLLALAARSLLAHTAGEPRPALALGLRTAELARKTGMRAPEQLALLAVGHAAMDLGETGEAGTAYQQILAADTSGGVLPLGTAAQAGLARATLVNGPVGEAVAIAEPLLGQLAAGAPVGAIGLARAYLDCARVLAAADDPRATQIVASGGAWLAGKADQLAAGPRRDYLEGIAAHRELLDAWHRKHPRHDVPTPAAHSFM